MSMTPYEFGALVGSSQFTKQAAPNFMAGLRQFFSRGGTAAARRALPAVGQAAAGAADDVARKLTTHPLGHAELGRLWQATAPGAVKPIDVSKLTTHPLGRERLMQLWHASAPGAVKPIDTSKLTTHPLGREKLMQLWHATGGK